MDLTHKALHALKWRYAGTAFQLALRFTIGVILARLLSPEAFGVVGVALITIGFGKLLGGMGFGVAIIQRARVTQAHMRAAFTGSMAVGVLIFMMLWFLAPIISHAFSQDALTSIIRIIGVSLVFSGISTIPVCMLRRELRFRMLAVIETVSYAVGFGVVGVSLALLGYGVWSLVVANIIQPICLMFLAGCITKQPIWPHFRAQEYYDLFHIAYAEVLHNITNYVATNLDFFVIGKWLGMSALGLYERSFHLTRLSVQSFSETVSTVMFPLYAQVQGDVPRLGKAYLRTVSLSAMLTMPALFAMATVPEIIIGGLLGGQWKAAAGVFQILCVSGPLIAITSIGGALSHARGYVLHQWRRQLVFLATMGIAIYSFLPYGIEGVALAVLIAQCARYFLLAQLSIRLAGIGWRHFFFAQVPGALLSITVSIPVFLASFIGNIYAVSDILQLVWVAVVFMLSAAVSFFLIPPSYFGDLYPWVIEHFGVNFPNWLRQIMVAKALKSGDLPAS